MTGVLSDLLMAVPSVKSRVERRVERRVAYLASESAVLTAVKMAE